MPLLPWTDHYSLLRGLPLNTKLLQYSTPQLKFKTPDIVKAIFAPQAKKPELGADLLNLQAFVVNTELCGRLNITDIEGFKPILVPDRIFCFVVGRRWEYCPVVQLYQ